MNPQEAYGYWDSLNKDPLPSPVREFTDADAEALHSYYSRTSFGFITKGASGRGYLDLLQRIRTETGHPTDKALFDSSHIITAVEIDRMQKQFATTAIDPTSQG